MASLPLIILYASVWQLYKAILLLRKMQCGHKYLLLTNYYFKETLRKCVHHKVENCGSQNRNGCISDLVCVKVNGALHPVAIPR